MVLRDPLDPGLERALDRLGPARLLVVVSARDCAGSVRTVVEAAASALAGPFAGERAAVLVVDGGSRDGTVDAARRADAGPTALAVVGPPARAGRRLARVGVERWGALPVLLAARARTGASACAVVDGGVRAITPEWVRLLLEPVATGGLDLVAPLYARHRYDGLLTGHVVYPLTRALYGWRLRQPLGAHFGLSGRLAGWLQDSGGAAGTVRMRGDVWLATAALAAGLAVGQAWLGPGRRGPRDSGADLMDSFGPVVGTVFALMEQFRAAWGGTGPSRDVPTFGTPVPPEEAPLWVDVDRMAATFRQALADLMPVWRRMLAPETCAAVAGLAAEPSAVPRFPARLWARVVYDAALARHARRLPREQLLRALAPLYLGRAASSVLRTLEAGSAEVEADVEALCEAFESLKPYLLDRWGEQRP